MLSAFWFFVYQCKTHGDVSSYRYSLAIDRTIVYYLCFGYVNGFISSLQSQRRDNENGSEFGDGDHIE